MPGFADISSVVPEKTSKVVDVFLLLCYYIPLDKCVALHLKKKKTPFSHGCFVGSSGSGDENVKSPHWLTRQFKQQTRFDFEPADRVSWKNSGSYLITSVVITNILAVLFYSYKLTYDPGSTIQIAACTP